MSNSIARIASICALVAVTASCSSGSRSSRPAPVPAPQPAASPQPTVVVAPSATTPTAAPATADRKALGVPPGHLPPPGSCRLWFPARPPGQQPKAGDCSTIQRQAPAGSWVLYRPQNDAKVVHSRVIDAKRPGAVVTVRVYDVKRGTYIRDERPAAEQPKQEDKPKPGRGRSGGQT